MLRRGGTVLTQQVARDDWRELRWYFPRMTTFPDHFVSYQAGFEDHGLRVVHAQMHNSRVAYATLGDLVYMLCVISWAVPDIDPLGHDLEALLDLERELSTPDGIVLTESRYIIEARKPP